MMRRWRRLLYAGAGVAAAGVATLLAISAVTVEHAIAPTVQGGCYNVSVDGGSLPTAPIDAGTEAGVRLWKVTITGTAVLAPVTLQIFDGDLANKISDAAIASAGSWSRELVLSLGWHKLIFRVLRGGRSWETVRWVGLATGAPSWSPAWNVEPDGGARCWDAGCVPVGIVPRCGAGARFRCSDLGCLDAAGPFGGPVGCVRGCGALAPIPDAGCSGGNCPGLTDSGHAYRPSCCSVAVGSSGMMRTPAYSLSGLGGLASEISAQVTSGSKVTIVSSASGDKSLSVSVYGVCADGVPRLETILTNSSAGTTPVTGTLKWTTILGAIGPPSPTGTITMTSTTGGQTILTLSSAAKTKGMRWIGDRRGAMVGQRTLRLAADGETTATVMIHSADGVEGVTLSGTTPVSTLESVSSLQWLAVGGLDDARSISLAADEGWCTGGIYSGGFVGANGRAGEVLLNINFAGISDPGGAGCGAHHIMVMVGESKLAWPPPPRDAGGYSMDAWRASVYRRWAYECRPRPLGSSTVTVPWNRDAGAAGQPHCNGGWCCVLSKSYPVPDGGS
jgi:hypothetical protein